MSRAATPTRLNLNHHARNIHGFIATSSFLKISCRRRQHPPKPPNPVLQPATEVAGAITKARAPRKRTCKSVSVIVFGSRSSLICQVRFLSGLGRLGWCGNCYSRKVILDSPRVKTADSRSSRGKSDWCRDDRDLWKAQTRFRPSANALGCPHYRNVVELVGGCRGASFDIAVESAAVTSLMPSRSPFQYSPYLRRQSQN